MKKSLLCLLSTLFLLTGCVPNDQGTTPPPQKNIVDIEVVNPKTDYIVNDSFVKPEVNALYDDESKEDVKDNCTFAGFDSSAPVEHQIVTVSYQEFVKEYTVSISKKAISITVTNKIDTFEIGDDFIRSTVIATFNDNSTEDVTNDATFSGFDSSNATESQTITVTYLGLTTTYIISIVDSSTESKELTGMAKAFDNSDSRSKTDLTVVAPLTFENMFSISFGNNGGSNKPLVNSKDGWKINLYQNNSMTITSLKKMKKIEIPLIETKGALNSDVGEASIAQSMLTWTGSTRSVTFTAVATNRFDSMTIYYEKDEGHESDLEGISTIAEVLEAASHIEYLPNSVGWYLSNVGVTVEVEAIDTIDSKAISSGYDPNARGKTIARDETSYIVVSSGTTSNNPVSLYHRVKEHIGKSKTTYYVEGHIAFLNGVVEVRLDSYHYDENIEISASIDSLASKTIASSATFVDETLEHTATNNKGYGINNIVNFTGLTYLNKYNSAGSYLFTDQEGNLVPVYSLVDKDRYSLVQGQCYDIIGLESVYNYRPSLRILKVNKSELESVDYDFENDSVELNNLTTLYSVKQGTNSYPRSELTIYSAEVYVSSYRNDPEKYSFNTTYYYNNSYKKYMTGSDAVDAARHNSIGVFNENIAFNQTLLDFDITECKSVEAVEACKVTLYFTLAYLDTVDSKSMWRVNIFEDLVYSLDYYESENETIEFDLSKEGVICDRVDGEYQTWSKSGSSLTVKNESTSGHQIEREVSYLKIVNETKLTISFDKDIIGFTLFTGTYSYINSLGSLEIFAYKQFAHYTLIILEEPTKEIIIDSLGVGSNHNNPYLKVTSLQINYLEA